MERFFGVAQDINGNAVPSCTVTVNLAGTGTAATLYSDNAYTPLANPFTSEPDGAYQFYAADGRYDVTLVKTGYTFDNDDTANVMLSDRFSVISPAQITADTNDYSPTNGFNVDTWRINSDATRTLTGIVAGKAQQQIRLTNVGSFNINLAHASGSSTLGNRFTCPNARDFALFPNRSADIYYDSTSSVWRVATTQMDVVLDKVAAGTTISNSAAETTIYSFTVPGGLLSTVSKLRFTLTGRYTNSTGGADDTTLRLKYGGATVATALQLGIAINTNDVILITGHLSGNSATNAQVGTIFGWSGNAAAVSHNATGGRGTSAIDSTVDQTFLVSWDFQTASNSITFTRESAVLEWLP